MDVRQIVELVKQTPQVQQAVDIIEQQLDRAPIMPEDLDEMIRMLEAVVEDPSRYGEVRAAAIKDGIMSEQDAPQEYDPTFVLSVLIALYEYRDRLSAKGYARGGLKVAGRQLAAAGRGGDSMLAHINPREAEMLRRMGGAGTINPNTGLREYKGSFGKVLAAVAPIALSFIAPGLGTTIGTALGASGAAATALGGAIIGGVTTGLAGGNILKGAALGALGGGFGDTAGAGLNQALGLNLGSTAQSVLGGALVGGVTGAMTGQGFGKGALMGAAGSGLGAAAQGVGEGAFGAGFGNAGKTFGNMLAAGYRPKEALIGGALSGLATGLTYKAPEPSTGSGLKMKPSDAVVDGLKLPPGQDAVAPRVGTTNYMTGEQGVLPGQAPQLVGNLPAEGLKIPGDALNVNLPNIQGTTTPTAAAASTSPIDLKTVGTLALLSSAAAKRPPEVNDAINSMSPAQQEYFNRPSIIWDWNKMQADANANNMSLSQFMSAYWPQITAGNYSTTQQTAPTAMAMGGRYANGGMGPLGAVARLVRGGGSGRDDTINARLSDGEYVMDAETVAMLGDGSTDAGAKRLDAMRAQLRKHKGRTLAKGKFSPNAKSPLAYLKGAA